MPVEYCEAPWALAVDSLESTASSVHLTPPSPSLPPPFPAYPSFLLALPDSVVLFMSSKTVAVRLGRSDCFTFYPVTLTVSRIRCKRVGSSLRVCYRWSTKLGTVLLDYDNAHALFIGNFLWGDDGAGRQSLSLVYRWGNESQCPFQ